MGRCVLFQTFITAPVEHNVVTLDPKFFGRQCFNARHAMLQFKCPAAKTTVEMMMMRASRVLVSRSGAGDVHQQHTAICLQSFEQSVNRCNAQSRTILLRELLNFRRRQRPLRFLEDFDNGSALFGIPLHTSQLEPINLPTVAFGRIFKNQAVSQAQLWLSLFYEFSANDCRPLDLGL